MCIARYRELSDHPYFKYEVELIVIGNGKRTKIAAINCRDESELEQATQWVDFVLKGEDLQPSKGE